MTLKLNKETLKALTDGQIEQAQGGLIVTLHTFEVTCQKSIVFSQCGTCITCNVLCNTYHCVPN